MHNVTLSFDSPAALRAALARAVAERRIDWAAPEAPGTLCKLVVAHGDAELALFALAAAGGYKLTDDPADVRFEINRFLAALPPDEAPEAPPAAPEAAPAVTEIAEEVPDEAELSRIQSEVGSKDPILEELKRIQKLPVPQKIKLAEDGDLTQRTLLYRMYGKLVFDGLLRNPRLTEVEVARLAKLGTLGQQQLQVITRKPEWLRSERIRNALLSNPRVPAPVVQKILGMLGKNELRQLVQRRDLPQAVQQAVREANARKNG